MRRTTAGVTAALLGLSGMVVGTASADPGDGPLSGAPDVDQAWVDLAREVLPEGDGWASEGAGTSGGSAAAEEDVVVVRTWQELRDALGGSSAGTQTTPRIILVEGRIEAFGFDDEDSALPTCADFASAVTVAADETGPERPFTMAEYIEHYDPEVWGRDEPSGPLETARAEAAALQTLQVRQRVGSGVTIFGIGDDAEIVGAHLSINQVSDVIVRNVTVSDAFDCFPEWDPTDGSAGNWNSLYDNISVIGSDHVWVDQVTLDDGEHPRQDMKHVYGRPFEVHDGLLDITHSADLVTVSYSVLDNHDKTSLVGSSDSRLADVGMLRTTWHHNRWEDVGQRAPRVRFGDVDVYNNLYSLSTLDGFSYFWGVGVESSVYAEKNVFSVPAGFDPAQIVRVFGGTRLLAVDTLVDGQPVDVVAVYNDSVGGGQQLDPTARWAPVLRTQVDPVDQVEEIVRAEAGAGRLVPAPASASAPAVGSE